MKIIYVTILFLVILILSAFIVIESLPPISQKIPVAFGDVSGAFTYTHERIFAGVKGDCVNLIWEVDGIDRLFIQDQGMPGIGERWFCPMRELDIRIVTPDQVDHVIETPYVRSRLRLYVILAFGLLLTALSHIEPFNSWLQPIAFWLRSHSEHVPIPPLTSLRMFAALLVFVVHYHPLEYTGIFLHGYLGVAIFFALSGFLITIRYADGFYESGLNIKTYLDYMIRRIARIYPLYFFILLTLVFAGQTDFFSTKFMAYATVTASMFRLYFGQVFPVAWTITVEFQFYLIAPLIFLTGRWLHKRFCSSSNQAFIQIINLGLWVGGLLIMGVMIDRYVDLYKYGGFLADIDHIYRLNIWGRFFDFAIGMGVGFLYIHNRLNPIYNHPRARILLTSLTVISIVAFIVLLAILARVYPVQVYGMYTHTLPANYAGAICAGLFILSIVSPKNLLYEFLSLRLLVYLGQISYAVYLIQDTPLMKFGDELQRFVALPLTPMWFFVNTMMLYIVASLIGSILYTVIEKPANRGLRNTYQELKKVYQQKKIGHQIE